MLILQFTTYLDIPKQEEKKKLNCQAKHSEVVAKRKMRLKYYHRPTKCTCH